MLVGGSHSFRLTANNVGLLRNTTTVTVSRNDGGKDAYAAVRAIDRQGAAKRANFFVPRATRSKTASAPSSGASSSS